MNLTLIPANLQDAELLYKMQVESFLPLYLKYQDHDTNPAAEPIDNIIERLHQPQTDFYRIHLDETPVGGVRVVRCENSEYRISPLFVLPAFQNRGIAQQVIRMLFDRYSDAKRWTLETILQEKGNCHLYEKCGFMRVPDKEMIINERLTLIFYVKEMTASDKS